MVSEFSFYIHDFFFSDGHPQQYCSSGNGAAVLSQLFLGYLLLATLLWANDWNKHPALRHMERGDLQVPIPAKASKIAEKLVTWETLAEMLPFRLDHLLCEAELPIDLSSTIRHQQPSEADSNLLAGIKNLAYSQRHSTLSDRHAAVSAIYSMSFLLNWYSPVSKYSTTSLDIHHFSPATNFK
jgi:hypothetical protein